MKRFYQNYHFNASNNEPFSSSFVYLCIDLSKQKRFQSNDDDEDEDRKKTTKSIIKERTATNII